MASASAAVTNPNLVGKLKKWIEDADAKGALEVPVRATPTLAVIDEPASAITTTTIKLAEARATVAALRNAIEDDINRGARQTDREVRKRISFRRGPLIEPGFAARALPAVNLVAHMLALGDEPVDRDERVRVTLRALLRAHVDTVWADEQSVDRYWVSDLRGVVETTPEVPGSATWESIDVGPWLELVKVAIARAVGVGSSTAVGGDVAGVVDATAVALTDQAALVLGEGDDQVPRALEAVRAVAIVRALASWFSPAPGRPTAMVRADTSSIAITAPNELLIDALRLARAAVVLDGTPDRVGLEAAARWAGRTVRWLEIDVADGADVERVIIYASGSGKRAVLRGKEVAWPALGPLLAKALDRAAAAGATNLLLVTFEKAATTLRGTLPRGVPALGEIPHEGARAALARWYGRGGTVVVAHFFGLRGLNELRATDDRVVSWLDLDAVITLGDAYARVDEVLAGGELLGLDEDQREVRLRELAMAELGQAHGRLRPPVRERPGISIHIGHLVPAGWDPSIADIERLDTGRPARRSDMDSEKVRALVGRVGSQRALSEASAVSESVLSRILSGERAATPEVAEKLRAVAQGEAFVAPARELSSRSDAAQTVRAATDPWAPVRALLTSNLDGATWAAAIMPLPKDDEAALVVLRARVARIADVQRARDASFRVARSNWEPAVAMYTGTGATCQTAWLSHEETRARRLLAGEGAVALARVTADRVVAGWFAADIRVA